MPAHEHLQGQLFDPKTTRPRDKGEVAFHEWLDQPNVAYHGTFNDRWQDSPYHHFGDVHAASDRLHTAAMFVSAGPASRAAYYSGESVDHDAFDPGDIFAEPETHTGMLHARKLDLIGQRKPLSDPGANAAHHHAQLMEGYEPHEISESVRGSSVGLVKDLWHEPQVAPGREQNRIKAASRALQMGKGITYRNVGEPGETGISHVAPRGAQSTWEEDVVTSRHASTMAKGYAQDRLNRGEASTVPFQPRGKIPGYEALWQGTLENNGAGHSPKVSRPHISKLQFTTED